MIVAHCPYCTLDSAGKHQEGCPFKVYEAAPPLPQNPGWLCPACGRGVAPWQPFCPCKGYPEWKVTCSRGEG